VNLYAPWIHLKQLSRGSSGLDHDLSFFKSATLITCRRRSLDALQIRDGDVDDDAIARAVAFLSAQIEHAIADVRLDQRRILSSPSSEKCRAFDR